MRGKLACEGSTCPLPCGVRELGIIFLFRLSPKWDVNPIFFPRKVSVTRNQVASNDSVW
jgi:hypothetical protein